MLAKCDAQLVAIGIPIPKHKMVVRNEATINCKINLIYRYIYIYLM